MKRLTINLGAANCTHVHMYFFGKICTLDSTRAYYMYEAIISMYYVKENKGKPFVVINKKKWIRYLPLLPISFPR